MMAQGHEWIGRPPAVSKATPPAMPASHRSCTYDARCDCCALSKELQHTAGMAFGRCTGNGCPALPIRHVDVGATLEHEGQAGDRAMLGRRVQRRAEACSRPWQGRPHLHNRSHGWYFKVCS
jgi:hypothetical protein